MIDVWYLVVTDQNFFEYKKHYQGHEELFNNVILVVTLVLIFCSTQSFKLNNTIIILIWLNNDLIGLKTIHFTNKKIICFKKIKMIFFYKKKPKFSALAYRTRDVFNYMILKINICKIKNQFNFRMVV